MWSTGEAGSGGDSQLVKLHRFFNMQRRQGFYLAFFREGLLRLGFRLLDGQHPIVPIMLDDAVLANQFAAAMLKQGIYVVAFSFPVLPKGSARIRTQMSAALTQNDLEFALQAFARVKNELSL